MQAFNQALNFANAHRVLAAWGAVAGTYVLSCAIKGRAATDAAIKNVWNEQYPCQKNHPWISKLVKWGAAAAAVTATAYYGDWKGAIESLWNQAFPKPVAQADRVAVTERPAPKPPRAKKLAAPTGGASNSTQPTTPQTGASAPVSLTIETTEVPVLSSEQP